MSKQSVCEPFWELKRLDQSALRAYRKAFRTGIESDGRSVRRLTEAHTRSCHQIVAEPASAALVESDKFLVGPDSSYCPTVSK